MKKRILLLDDEMDFAAMVRLTLELTGRYAVRTAVRPSTFMQVAKAFKPDLILLDCMMPAMDGGEVAGLLQADPELKNTPFMFLTATIDYIEHSESHCYEGVQTFLPKTMELSDLIRYIDSRLTDQSAAAA